MNTPPPFQTAVNLTRCKRNRRNLTAEHVHVGGLIMPRLPNVCWFRQAPNAEGGGVINQKRRVSGGGREGGLVIQNDSKKSDTCMQISVVHYYCAYFVFVGAGWEGWRKGEGGGHWLLDQRVPLLYLLLPPCFPEPCPWARVWPGLGPSRKTSEPIFNQNMCCVTDALIFRNVSLFMRT